MKELLLNNNNSATYNIFVNGVLTDADDEVTVSLFKDGEQLVDSVSATRTELGKYKYNPPTSVVSTEGLIEIEWTFEIAGSVLSVKEYYQVVTPYCEWIDFYNLDRFTYADWLEAERVSRHVINGYCGQRFGKEDAVLKVEGNGSNNLHLPWRLIDFENIEWLERNVPRPGEVIGTSEYNFEVTSDGWTLRLQPNNVYIDPVYNPKPTFRRNIIFNVEGTWGYEFVPTAVSEASKILTANYLCADHKYRDRYLESAKMGERSFKFNSLAFEGTGDATADSLLADYRNFPGFMVI